MALGVRDRGLVLLEQSFGALPVAEEVGHRRLEGCEPADPHQQAEPIDLGPRLVVETLRLTRPTVREHLLGQIVERALRLRRSGAAAAELERTLQLRDPFTESRTQGSADADERGDLKMHDPKLFRERESLTADRNCLLVATAKHEQPRTLDEHRRLRVRRGRVADERPGTLRGFVGLVSQPSMPEAERCEHLALGGVLRFTELAERIRGLTARVSAPARPRL